jgi:hypothetical protein
MQKKKIVLWVLLLAITHLFCFVGGSMRSRQITLENLAQGLEQADAHVELSHYVSYRDIALDIKSSKKDRAMCEAKMAATSMFDVLQHCLANSACRINIEKKAQEFAPELLGDKPLPIERITSCSMNP